MPKYIFQKSTTLITSLGCALALAVLPATPARGQDDAKTTSANEASQNKKMSARAAGLRTRDVRTLDAINIEGKIAVPQVLFITSRDFRRYRDGLALKFHKNSLDVTRSLDRPTRLRFVTRHEEEK